MHPKKFIVWCEYWAGIDIGSYSFKNEADLAITVNGKLHKSVVIAHAILASLHERF